MPPAAKLALALVAILAFPGCGEVRPRGEPGGVPVSFIVDLDLAYIDAMASLTPRPPPMFLSPYPYSYRHAGYGRYRYAGRPFLYEDPWCADTRWTDVWLLGGDGPAEAGVFRMPLGEHVDFTVPIRPGHVVTLTVQARGDREGWEAVGHFTVADRPGQSVHLDLKRSGPRMTVVEPADYGPPPPPAAPPAPDQPPAP